MARTTAADVKAIINVGSILDDAGVTVFITTANLMVTANLTGKGLSDVVLTEIEKWLSAHLISITKVRQAESKKVGDAADKYGRLGFDLSATTYGQTVKILDTSGTLAELGLKAVSIEAVPSFDDSPLYD